MRICYFTPGFPKEGDYTITKGGAEDVAYNLVISMAERGNKVFVFTISNGSVGSIEDLGSIRVCRYNGSFKIFDKPVSLKLEYKPFFYDIDIVHIHTGGQLPLFVSFLFKVIKRKPLVVTYHGDFYVKGNILMRSAIKLYNELQDKLLKIADVVISPSKFYSKESRILRKHRNKVIVIPNGLNLNKYNVNYSKEECREELGLPLNKKIILFLSAIREKKAPDVLIRAMQKIAKKIPDAYLVMAGKGRMESKIKQLARELAIDDLITFPGFVRESEKPLYFKAADVFVLPSYDEIFGIVILEAMACGTPVVATRIGGIPEIVKDKKNGLLVPPKDPNALADAIIYLLGNEELRRKMGKRGKEMVRAYIWEKIAEKTEKVYEAVLKNANQKLGYFSR